MGCPCSMITKVSPAAVRARYSASRASRSSTPRSIVVTVLVGRVSLVVKPARADGECRPGRPSRIRSPRAKWGFRLPRGHNSCAPVQDFVALHSASPRCSLSRPAQDRRLRSVSPTCRHAELQRESDSSTRYSDRRAPGSRSRRSAIWTTEESLSPVEWWGFGERVGPRLGEPPA